MVLKGFWGACSAALGLCLPLTVFFFSDAGAQATPVNNPNRHACARPAEEHVGQAGCFHDGSVDLGVIAGQRWWHIDEFPEKLEVAVEGPLVSNHQDVVIEAAYRGSASSTPTTTTIASLRRSRAGSSSVS